MTSTATEPAHQEPLAFLAGGGEMGERIRAFDWSSTSLGAPESWPQSLRSAVSILLPSRAQIIVFWGPDLITIYNDAYQPVFGAKHPHVLGLPAREAWKEIWDVGLKELFEGVVNTGVTYWASDRLFFLERYGYPEETFFDVSYDPVRDETGRVGGVFCIVNDTTARVVGARRLRTLTEFGARIAEAARSPAEACVIAEAILGTNRFDVPFSLFYLLDAEGRKARLCSACDFGGDAVPAQEIDLFAPNEHSSPWPLCEVMTTGHAQIVTRVEERLGLLPGNPWPEPTDTAVVLPIRQSAQHRVAGFLVAGVSPRLPLDKEYLAFLDLVTAQVSTAITSARSFEEEKRRAEALAELDRAKTAFFSNVSHEFRTPLTLMLGPVEEMLNQDGADLTPSAREQLAIVSRNGLRLLRLVNTLLDFSRIEAGRVRAAFRPIDLAVLTTDLASVFRAACERAGLRLIVDCPPLSEPVFVDAEMWEKVVLNLLSNAFKFTFEGEIVVSMRCAGTAIELEVTDTGTGIPAEEMPRLFERFHRVRDARGRTHEGSGIGLALVQELVKLHGGSISAESRVGAGTTFVVSLPLGSAHLPADQVTSQLGPAMVDTAASPFIEEAMRWFPDDPSSKDVIVSELTGIGNSLEVPRPQRPAHENDTRPLVLIADDNADMRQYVARLLGKQYRVETVADGEAALIAVRARTPDLVLTDVMMPRLDGLGLLKALRAGPETRAIPVILLSARAGEELRSEGLEAGADDYMVKPFSARELRARVGANLQMARLRRETDQALFQRGEQFMTLIDRAPLGVYLIDADFRVREVNPIAQSFFGDPSGGIVGRDFAEVIHILWDTEYADEVVDIFRSTLETGESYVAPERARFRIDRQITEYHEWRLDRILLPDGRNGLVCYFRDISPQVNARLSIAEFAERLRLALDAAALGTFIWHLQEDRAEPDAQMRSLLGLSSEEHLSKASALATMIPSDDATRYRAAVARAIDPAGSGTLREDVRVVHPDGSEHWLAITGQTFFQGEPPVAVRMAGTASDITDRKRREANLEFLAESQDLFASLTSAAEIVQAVGTKLGVYLRASTCYFVDIDDTRDGARFEYIWDVEGSPRIPASIHTSDFVSGDFDHALRIGEVVIVRDSDYDPRTDAVALRSIRTRSLVAVPFQRQGELRFVLAVTDSQPRDWRADEIELIRELSNRIFPRLERAIAEAALRDADRRKDEFLATLAHELRNPLAPLRNGLELIKLAKDDSNAVRHARTIMERQLRHMVRLIDDLLDVSRISRGKLELRREHVAVSRIVEHAVETSRPLIEANGHYLTIVVPRDPIFVDGDITRLAQVVSNLLNNAAKYTERGGQLTLTVARDENDAVISVRDSGIGIPPTMLPRVFDLFVQVDPSLERAQGGLGIGLSLVKWLVEMHRGKVEARSAGHGMGSEFVVRLPVDVLPVADRATEVSLATTQPMRYRILVVDDNHDTASTLAMMLKIMGNETQSAQDGLEALEKAEKFLPDVILLDIGMPKLNGYDTARRIREQPWGQFTQLVALTGWGQVEDRRRTQEVGFNFHMVKPVEPAALEELLVKLESIAR